MSGSSGDMSLYPLKEFSLLVRPGQVESLGLFPISERAFLIISSIDPIEVMFKFKFVVFPSAWKVKKISVNSSSTF